MRSAVVELLQELARAADAVAAAVEAEDPTAPLPVVALACLVVDADRMRTGLEEHGRRLAECRPADRGNGAPRRTSER